MTWIALKMLTADRGKYYAIIFGVTFASLLIAEQSATFCGIMLRTTSQIRDMHGADVPKMSLTGINVERVDTRVVQLIYAIDPRHKLVREKKILVGQLLDVFIDTAPNEVGEPGA
jgi:hypothetical protein